MWKIKKLSNEKIQNPILIEGLPGIGNIGKITTDFIIDKLNAKKIYEITSYKFPHCVFINEENIVELPTIEIFHKKLNNKSLLFLVGDVQPIDEYTCYEFCDKILDIFQKHKGKEIITLGGIAIERVPKNPKVYCTGTNKRIIKKYKGSTIGNLSEIVGPIIGVSGLLTGLAGRRKIPAVSLFVETFAHPNFLGVKGAKEILKILNKKFNLKLKPNELDDELIKIEKEIQSSKRRSRKIMKKEQPHHTTYIG